jgi:cell division protein FtsB
MSDGRKDVVARAWPWVTLIALAVMFFFAGIRIENLRQAVALLEYRVSVLEGEVEALQNDDSDVALATLHPAVVREDSLR